MESQRVGHDWVTHTHTHTRNLYESLAGESILGCKSSPFITLNISCYSLLNCRVSAEKSADNLMGILLCVIYWFSLVVFSIFSLYLILLVSLICVSAWSSWVYPVWDSALSGLRWLFPFPCYRGFPLWSLQIFSDSLSFSSFSLTPIIWKLSFS